MSLSPQREDQLFAAALALPPADRHRYLEQACGGELLRRVEALLSVHEEARDFLETSAVVDRQAVAGAGAPRPPPEDATGTLIGRYKLLQKIGEGGCGTVYMAEQEEPVRRRVALKVIRLGMDTRDIITRFEAERQALALMDHPNIARVFDAGATATGRPFFVMELVRGVKITDFCDQQSLPTADRLSLFIQVCHAVQHAHQKGIIHRDLKPSNILVALQDGTPVPKVIDFGIAKATQGRLTDRTLFTAFEQIIGTPAYMSPEQAELSSQDIDTRSDIYSLGVLLYELLTGRTPFETKELLKAGLDEMRRQIREVEPPKPSTRLRTLEAAALTTTAQHRQVEPLKLIHLVRGDLDWIVMRCLEKNRVRRYATANELALDLECHQRDDPVTARPPTAGYLFRRLVRRHRRAVAAGALVFGVFFAAAVVSTALAVRATRAERRMERIMQVFKRMLDGMGQTAALGPDSSLAFGSREWRQILDETAQKATKDLHDQPEVAAELEHLFGKIYLASADYRHAEMALRASWALRQEHLGPDHPDTIQTLYDLGITLGISGRHEEGDQLMGAALAARSRTLGRDHAETVRTLETLAYSTWSRGDFVRAEPMFREALESRRRTGRLEDLDNAHMSPRQGLTMCLLSAGRFREGEALARENLATVTSKLGPQHRMVSLANLLVAWSLDGQHRYADAQPFCRTAVTIDRATLEPDHRALSDSLYELATCLDYLGNPADAPEVERLYRESLAIWRARQASANPNNMIYRLVSLGRFLAQQGRFGEGASQFDEAWDILTSCDRPTCVRQQAETIKKAIDLYAMWGLVDSSQAKGAVIWMERMARFEESTMTEAPSVHRANAILGLAETFGDWATVDPAKAARAAFWQEQLRACTRTGPVVGEGTPNPPSPAR